jgi:predicted O-methyltransferase YrrM
MAAMEKHASRTGFPIIGPAAGNFCYQIARQLRARSVFELGSGFGYSTAWFARAVRENGGGVVHHTVWDEDLSKMARLHLSRMGYEDLIQYHVAEAVSTLRAQPGQFDIIFNDIEKHDYPGSLTVIKEKLRPGGVLIIDNMLWSGRIFDKRDRSRDTRGVLQFTKAIKSDRDWIVTLVPVRDGLLIAYLGG